MPWWSKLGPKTRLFGSFVLAALPLTFMKAFLISGNNKMFQTHPNFFPASIPGNNCVCGILICVSDIRDHNLGAWGACEHRGEWEMGGWGGKSAISGVTNRKIFLFKVMCLYYFFWLNATHLVASTYFSHSRSRQWPLSLFLQLSAVLPTPSCKRKGGGQRFTSPLIEPMPLPPSPLERCCPAMIGFQLFSPLCIPREWGGAQDWLCVLDEFPLFWEWTG